MLYQNCCPGNLQIGLISQSGGLNPGVAIPQQVPVVAAAVLAFYNTAAAANSDLATCKSNWTAIPELLQQVFVSPPDSRP